ncbi:MAG: cell division protein FtsA [Chloroflexi bacterium]|nr:cell division protein FtsA [Chloroflexota bacterium]
MNRDSILAAIDVGSAKVCTLVAEITPDDDLRILGVGITPSEGVKRGMVDNIQEATDAIVSSVEKAERSSGSRIISAQVSLGGNHIASLNNRGVATMPGRQRPIMQDDINRALEGAQAVNIPTNREVVHIIPRFFVVDGQEHVSDPVGMFGQRLDVESHLVTGSLTAIQNLTQCVEGAGVQVDSLVLAPLAAAEAVLEDEEKRQGVVVADIGGGTTDIAVFVEGSAFHTSVLPVGGFHLTHDLVAGLRAPFSAVEEAKLEYGSALPSRVDPEEMVEMEAFGGQRQKAVSRRRISEILQARVEEVLEMVYMDVKRAGFDEMIAAGLVLTGGTASLPGLDELAEQVLRMPVRIGMPRGIHGLADSLNGPAYATSVGLLHWDISHNGHNGHKPRHFKAPNIELGGVWENMRKWLKALIPQ